MVPEHGNGYRVDGVHWGPLPRWCWVFFVRSVLSDVENPACSVLRAFGETLVAAGQEVLFLEERGNPAVVALLRQQGARALTAFAHDHPQLRYHTYERRFGADLVEWLGRTLATADIAVVELGVDATLAGWVGALTRPHLQTYLLDIVDSPEAAVWRAHLIAGPVSNTPGVLDPAAFSAIVCADAWAPAYAARLPEEQILRLSTPVQAVMPADTATALARQLATLLLARVAAAPPRREA